MYHYMKVKQTVMSKQVKDGFFFKFLLQFSSYSGVIVDILDVKLLSSAETLPSVRVTNSLLIVSLMVALVK